MLVGGIVGLLGLLIWLIVRIIRRSLGIRRPSMVAALIVGPLLLATVASVLFVGFKVARVEGQAMAPALRHQDRLIVNKLAYALEEPQIGDIVMLRYPLNPSKLFLKRVIAHGGDRVQIVGGKVWRNAQPVDESFVPPEFRSNDDWGPRVVPEQHYFVMGDQRNNSSDSRHWGFVPRKYILGRVGLRWFPEFSRIH